MIRKVEWLNFELTIEDILRCHKNPDTFIKKLPDGKCYVDICNLLMADPDADAKREAYRQEMISLCCHVKEMQKKAVP